MSTDVPSLQKCQTLEQLDTFLAAAKVEKREGLFHTGRKVVVNTSSESNSPQEEVTLNQVVQKFEEIVQSPTLDKTHIARTLQSIKTLEKGTSFSAWQIGSRVVSWIGQKIFNREEHLTAIEKNLPTYCETLNKNFTPQELATPQALLDALYKKTNKKQLNGSVATYLADEKKIEDQNEKLRFIQTLKTVLNTESTSPWKWPTEAFDASISLADLQKKMQPAPSPSTPSTATATTPQAQPSSKPSEKTGGIFSFFSRTKSTQTSTTPSQPPPSAPPPTTTSPPSPPSVKQSVEKQGENLGNIKIKSDELAGSAQTFAEEAKKLAESEKAKKWWQI